MAGKHGKDERRSADGAAADAGWNALLIHAVDC